MIVSKAVKCRHCSTQVNIVNRRDAEGYSVTTVWESLRDHWEADHPAEFAELSAWLDADVIQEA